MTKRNLISNALIIFFLCTYSFSNSHSQTPLKIQGDRIVSPRDASIKEKWVAFKRNASTGRQREDVYTIPVVFHIIHQNGPENISDAAVMDAFQRLNDAFANRGIYDQGSGVDTKIQFCMAKKDPDGNHTTGINRVFLDIPKANGTNTGLIYSMVNWDPDKYINIYVVTEVDILIQLKHCGIPDFKAAGFGGNGTIVAQANSLNAVIVHEMGHALGLLHTFNNWCPNNDCLVDGDGICDTPPEETVSIQGTCSDPENSCHTDAQSGFTSDQNDLKTNHMDYGNGACRHDFTEGQKQRMRFEIETNHPTWLTSDGCINDCAAPAESEFGFPFIEYSIGRTINFTNTSTGATDYEWSLNNSVVASTVNYSYVFPAQGWYEFSLLAKPTPDEIKCRNKQVNFIRVYCSIKSVISHDKKKAQVGESIHFSSTITDVVPMPAPVQYEWYANGSLFGTTGPSIDHAFTTQGFYVIYLVTIRGGCRDTSLADEVIIEKDLADYTLDMGSLCTDNKANKIMITVCNKEGLETPPGLPITFYSADPTTGPAARVGTTFYTTRTIKSYCCEDFEIELPANFTGEKLFGVINDDYSHPPPYSLLTDFPVTSFIEIKYTNNLDSLSMKKFNVAILPGDVSVLIQSSVTLIAVPSEPASSITWTADHGTFSCNNCINTDFSPLRYTRVIVKAISEGDCVATDTIIVKVLANGEVFIPSAFTPNDDKLNDYFYVLAGASVNKINSFMVFNRWGEKVCDRKNVLPNIPHAGWDGRVKGYPAVPDVYAYLITVEFLNKTTREFKGTITVIR